MILSQIGCTCQDIILGGRDEHLWNEGAGVMGFRSGGSWTTIQDSQSLGQLSRELWSEYWPSKFSAWWRHIQAFTFLPQPVTRCRLNEKAYNFGKGALCSQAPPEDLTHGNCIWRSSWFLDSKSLRKWECGLQISTRITLYYKNTRLLGMKVRANCYFRL